MALCIVPTAESIGEFLESLLGTKVEAHRVEATTFDPKAPLVAAVYASEAGAPVGVWLCDLAFSASAGAALCVIPAEQAAECAKSGLLSEQFAENVKEVFNVGSRFFTGPTVPRTKLQNMHLPPGPLPPAVRMTMAKAPNRLNVDLAITGYPSGRATLFLA